MDVRELHPWLDCIEARRLLLRQKIGPINLALVALLSRVLSLHRSLKFSTRSRPTSEANLQMPWLPLWPNLSTNPIHEAAAYPWAARLRDSSSSIRQELIPILRLSDLRLPNRGGRWT
jgi:hypothetical protein